jgi:hypothetical protein
LVDKMSSVSFGSNTISIKDKVEPQQLVDKMSLVSFGSNTISIKVL